MGKNNLFIDYIRKTGSLCRVCHNVYLFKHLKEKSDYQKQENEENIFEIEE
jgi:hypothetical protein